MTIYLNFLQLVIPNLGVKTDIMTNPFTFLNSRQKELLLTLLTTNRKISYKELSELFKLSTRTIQREIKALADILHSYELKITKNIGTGLELRGSTEAKEKLKEAIEQVKILSAHSPKERQDSIIYDLLISKEPIKQYVFSKKYGVTEATISADLDKAAMWLEKGGIELIRTPGVGVYIEGQEKQRRTMLSRLLHKDITFDEWLELFSKKMGTEEKDIDGRLGMVIRNRLLKFIQTPNILDVERVVHHVLNEQTNIVLTERNYVNLIVHLILAAERIKTGEVIESNNLYKDYVFDSSITDLAEKIVKGLENALSISIPAIEMDYIVLHLSGARLSNEKEIVNYETEEFTWIELTQSFIRAMEYYLEESFDGDEMLFEGLVAHIAPAFNRLKCGLQIHNPMLDKIKESYPKIFFACKQACELLFSKTGCEVPDDEAGYLAMHIGAALFRKKETLKTGYKACVICSSGLGTSTFLASALRSKMPNITVEAVVSANKLEEWLKEENEADIFISTINLPWMKNKNVVVVSPFLNNEDLSIIQNSLTKVQKPKPIQKSDKSDHRKSPSILSLAKYGEGMIQILNNFKIAHYIEEHSEHSSDQLWTILNQLKDVQEISDIKQLYRDLEKREQLGGFVIGDLAMLHTKSNGVKQLLTAILRMKSPLLWTVDDEEQQFINAVLLLATPLDAPKEHIEMISEISSMLIEETFVNVLVQSSPDEVKAALGDILSKAYEIKATRSVKGFQGV